MSERISQIRIYTGKCWRIFFSEKGWINFIVSIAISIVICIVLSEDMFSEYSATKNGLFALICACIWTGIFNSIQSICKERKILKRDHRAGLHISSYITAHLLFDLLVCAAEALIILIVLLISKSGNMNGSGAALPTVIELYISFLFIIFSADALGIMFSSICKTTNTAMTVMPVILIVQLVLSGNIFPMSGPVPYIMIAKIGMNALGTTAGLNELPSREIEINDFPKPIPLDKNIPEGSYHAADYTANFSHLIGQWWILLLFSIIYAIVATIVLERIDKDQR